MFDFMLEIVFFFLFIVLLVVFKFLEGEIGGENFKFRIFMEVKVGWYFYFFRERLNIVISLLNLVCCMFVCLLIIY